MYSLNFNDKNRHIYFIGIGGISMSAIAILLNEKGFTVSGSDLTKNDITKHLESLGINVFYSQDGSHIDTSIDLIVYTAAIHEDNPEYIRAKSLNIPMLDRASCIGSFMKGYKNAIAIAGTHGKTTTTSMLATVYMEAGLDPTVFVGGMLNSINGNMRIGNSDNFILEACEYADSFLKFTPNTEIILNIEPEHLDFFKDFENEKLSYRNFAKILGDNGFLVINAEIPFLDQIIPNKSCKVVTYGIDTLCKGADYLAKNIAYNELGFPSFDLYIRNEYKERIDLSVAGLHNVSNALSVIATVLETPFLVSAPPLSIIKLGLQKYTGTDRRFQYKGKHKLGFTIVDDYAHHPTEITATINTARNTSHSRLIVAFQPHLYSRTYDFLDEFVSALSPADIVVFSEIYAAREKNTYNISSSLLRDRLTSMGKEAYFFKTFKEIENFLIHTCKQGDLLITMGAGDIVKVGENLLS